MADLTTLASVKSWLGITSTDAARDATLARLIKAQSRFIESWLSRTFASQQYVEVRDGFGMGEGRYAMSFANDPVSSVVSLSVNSTIVPASADGGIQQSGYGFDSDEIWIAPVGPYIDRFSTSGYEFSRGRRNVLLTYVGGFLVLPLGKYGDNNWLLPAEKATIPTTPYQITTSLTWLGDNAVAYVASGLPLTAVASAPAVGQYSVAAGTYTFAAADAGKQVALSYSYVPSDVEQCCIDLVALRWREKDRVGLVSQAVGTETVTYYQKDMPAQVATALQQYKRVFVL